MTRLELAIFALGWLEIGMLLAIAVIQWRAGHV